MLAKQLKDKLIRLNYSKKEVKVLPFSFLVNDVSLDPYCKFYINKKFLFRNKNFFKSQIKNRCVLSLRSRSPLTRFRLSRIKFRSLASNGALLGVKKSS